MRAEIELEKENVSEKKEKVLEAASQMIKNAKFDVVKVGDRTPGYSGGAFDGSIKKITDKLSKVAQELNKASKNMKSRISALQGTIDEVEGEWKSKAEAKKGAKGDRAMH